MWAIGIDVGGSNLRGALVDARGQTKNAQRHPLSGKRPEELLAQIEALVRALGPDAEGAPIAVGLAAQLLLATGTVAVAPNLGWQDVPMGPLLEAALGRPVRLVNDLDAITYGEARAGLDSAPRDLTCVFVGTGVGMGAVVDGRLLEGADGLATELGHIKVASPLTGRACGCGERGCLEAYTSGRHLPELYAQKVAEGTPGGLLRTLGGNLAAMTAGHIDAAAVEGDAAARALWDEVGERLGLAIANTVTVLNPRVLVLGGGVLGAAPSLRQRVETMLRAAAARPALARVEIRSTRLGDDAGLLGAGLLAGGW